MANISNHDESHWSLDKRIPLALILALVLQTGGISFWMGQLSTRVGQNETQIARTSGDADRLTRVEVQLQNIAATVQRVERILEDKP